MAALKHKILLPILLISIIALFLSAEAQYSYGDQDGAAPSGSFAVSSISSSPVASPAEAPVSTDSYDVSLAAVDVESSSGDSSSSESSSGDSSSSTMAIQETQPIISYDVPAAKKSKVNTFVQSTMQLSVAKTDNFVNGVIEKRLQDPQIDSYSKECLETCKDVYEESKGAMKKTLEDIHEGNYFKANVDISAISSNADSCKECVKSVYGEDPELDKFNKWVDGQIDQCLTMITGYHA